MRNTLLIAVLLPLFAITSTHAESDHVRSLQHQEMFTEAPWSQPSTVQLQLAKKWDELSSEEKKKVREAQERYKQLPQEKKQKLKKKREKVPDKETDKYKLERRYR